MKEHKIGKIRNVHRSLLQKEHKVGKIRRVHRSFIKAKNKAKRIGLVIGPVALYLAGDYAQDGMIDGSLLRTLAPYVTMLVTG